MKQTINKPLPTYEAEQIKNAGYGKDKTYAEYIKFELEHEE